MSNIFICFLGLNKLSFISHFHLVPNLEKILPNVSSSFQILVNFLDSWSTHALKVTIFKVLLLLRQNRESKLSGMKDNSTSFHWEVRGSQSDFDQLGNSRLNILYVCECSSISRHFSRPKTVVVYNNQILANVPKKFRNFFF